MADGTSQHFLQVGNACDLSTIDDKSINTVITSPPYPMIEMWDEIFITQDDAIGEALNKGKEMVAFEKMHQILDQVWQECYRVLKPGGFACINIGDATRTINQHFRLYPNHARILSACLEAGFSTLPSIIWRKQTNAPNKFMGSGMLPAGAYITLEHEYILVFRKGNKRNFTTVQEKQLRQQSAYFWEERNQWFSDVWFDLKGASQKLVNDQSRNRSGAFPFELAYRLINMYSVKQDMILDPFAGTGTTGLAAIATNRNSINVEIDSHLLTTMQQCMAEDKKSFCNHKIAERLANHDEFVANRIDAKGENCFKHRNENYDFPVMTRQEKSLILDFITDISNPENNLIEAHYSDKPESVGVTNLWGQCVS